MRKWLLLALALLLALPTALAEAGAFVDVAGEYDFSSGAGAWYTGLTIQEDGSFTGIYMDTDMEDGELDGVHYDATTYYCDFSGQLSRLEHASAQEMDCTVLELNYDMPEPSVEDGILIQSVEPYGIGQGDAIRFFMRGALVSAIPEELWNWLRFKEVDPDWETLPYVALYDETSGAGFSGTIPAEGE